MRMNPRSLNPTKQLNINALKNPICQKPHGATVYSWTVEHISFQTCKCWHFNAARFNIRSPSNPTSTTYTCSLQFQVLLEKSHVWLQNVWSKIIRYWPLEIEGGRGAKISMVSVLAFARCPKRSGTKIESLYTIKTLLKCSFEYFLPRRLSLR